MHAPSLPARLSLPSGLVLALLLTSACDGSQDDLGSSPVVKNHGAPSSGTATTADAAAPSSNSTTPSEDAGAAVQPISPTPTPDAGGSSVAAAPDAAAPVTTSGSEAGAGCAGAAVCDDFESDAVGSVPGGTWSLSTPSCSGTGAVAIDGSQAHSGQRSVKVTGGGGYCNHVFLATTAIAKLTGTIWQRFYVRLDTALGNDHVTFVAMHDATDVKDLRMGGQDGVLMFNRELDDATLPEMSPQGVALSVVPSVQTWHCVETEINGSAGTLTTYVDGAAVAGLAIGTTATTNVDTEWHRSNAWHPVLQDARFGWESYGSAAETLWFDDIAIGSQRIGCSP